MPRPAEVEARLRAQIDMIREQVSSGMAFRPLAQQLGISPTTLANFCLAHGIVSNGQVARASRKRLDPAAVRTLAGQGASDPEIARLLGTTRTVVKKFRDANDIPPGRPLGSALEPHKERIAAWATEGKPDCFIAGEIGGVSESAVADFRKKHGMKSGAWHKRQAQRAALGLTGGASINGNSIDDDPINNTDGMKFRGMLAEAEGLWDERLASHYRDDSDRKPFAETEDGDIEPGDNRPAALPAIERGSGGSNMGWAA